MRTIIPRLGWLKAFFCDWSTMAGAGQRVGALARLSDDALAREGYDRDTLLWQVYREHGVTLDDAPVAWSTALPDENAGDCITVARAELQTARAVLRREISDYPRPIAGCDAQFNHLLLQRKQIAAALQALSSERSAA